MEVKTKEEKAQKRVDRLYSKIVKEFNNNGIQVETVRAFNKAMRLWEKAIG